MSINDSRNKEKINSLLLKNNDPELVDRLNASKTSKQSLKNVEFNNKIEFQDNKQDVLQNDTENGKNNDVNLSNYEQINNNQPNDFVEEMNPNLINGSPNNKNSNQIIEEVMKSGEIKQTPDFEMKYKENKVPTEPNQVIELQVVKEEQNIYDSPDGIKKKETIALTNTGKRPILEKKKSLLAKDLQNEDQKNDELQIFKKNEVKEDKKVAEKDKDKTEIKIDSPTKVTKNYNFKAFFKKFLDYWLTTLIFTLLTVYALFADDVKMLTCDIVNI